MLNLLILIEFILLIFSYLIFNQDIISPPVMTHLVILLATILVIPSEQIWDVTIYSNTIIVITIGLTTIGIASYFSKSLFKRSSRKRNGAYSLSLIHCRKSMEKAIFFLSILLTVMYLVDAIRVGQMNGGSGFGAIAYMKQAYMSGNGARMNPIIRQGFKVVMIFGYISALIFSNNVLLLKEKVKYNISYLTAIICAGAITIFSGSRTEVLRIISALIVSYSLLYRESINWAKKGNAKSFREIIKKFLPIIIVFGIVAFASRTFVKTLGTGGSEISSITRYFSFYIGSPIQVLNIKLSYYKNASQLIFGNNASIPEFVYLGNLNYGGNVGTIFCTLYQYNGLLKMLLYLFIVYFIGSGFYYSLFDTHSSLKRNLKIVLFSYIYFIFTMSYYDNCVSVFFELSNIIVFFLIMLLYKPIVRNNRNKVYEL